MLTAVTTNAATIRRKTYALGGQPVALRVSGYPAGETGKNGLFYMHSDHASTRSGTPSSAQRLGSNSVMSYGQGHASNLVGTEAPGSRGRRFLIPNKIANSAKVDIVFADFDGNPPLSRAVTIRQTNTKLLIADTSNGIWSEEPELLVDVPLPAAQGETHSYQVVYDPAAGQVNVWRNGVWAVGWTFENPLAEGNYIVLRTRANSAAIFDDVVVSDGRGVSTFGRSSPVGFHP